MNTTPTALDHFDALAAVAIALSKHTRSWWESPRDPDAGPLTIEDAIEQRAERDWVGEFSGPAAELLALARGTRDEPAIRRGVGDVRRSVRRMLAFLPMAAGRVDPDEAAGLPVAARSVVQFSAIRAEARGRINRLERLVRALPDSMVTSPSDTALAPQPTGHEGRPPLRLLNVPDPGPESHNVEILRAAGPPITGWVAPAVLKAITTLIAHHPTMMTAEQLEAAAGVTAARTVVSRAKNQFPELAEVLITPRKGGPGHTGMYGLKPWSRAL